MAELWIRALNQQTERKTKSVTLSNDRLESCIIEASGIVKRRIADEYCASCYGFSYAWLLSKSTEDTRARLQGEIQRLRIHSSLILCGFGQDIDSDVVRGLIYRADEVLIPGENLYKVHVTEENNLSTIGSGGFAAQLSLWQRDYDTDCSLAEALYYAYEAKRLSELAPGVGRATDLSVIFPGGKSWQMKEHFLKRLEAEYTERRVKRLSNLDVFVTPKDYEEDQPSSPSNSETGQT